MLSAKSFAFVDTSILASEFQKLRDDHDNVLKRVSWLSTENKALKQVIEKQIDELASTTRKLSSCITRLRQLDPSFAIDSLF
jgi:ElaB/YqjD/DUF883 family membrane-anchored ribosome-binding protein